MLYVAELFFEKVGCYKSGHGVGNGIVAIEPVSCTCLWAADMSTIADQVKDAYPYRLVYVVGISETDQPGAAITVL